MITLNDVLWTNNDEENTSNQDDISLQSSNVMTIEMCCWIPGAIIEHNGWPACGKP